MIKEQKEKHKNLIEKTINFLKKLGHTDIKADIDGYESPTSFEMRNRNITVTPDIVSVTPNGKMHYVDLGVKSEKPILLKSKWKFLHTLSEIKNRSFRVITHRGHYGFTEKLLSEMTPAQTALKI